MEIKTFCPMCVSRCGATATVEDGRFVALGPDPEHPTGTAVCVKGKAAPEIVYHRDRLLHPLKRTNPKTDPDPGWQQISWDEALDEIAERLTAIARESGPESVIFSSASPSTSAMSDTVDWLVRLKRAFGSPNLVAAMELCGWGRHFASMYTFGESVPGGYVPELDNAGCILFWGYNPSVARLCHATATTAAKRRGAKLVVVDPRRVGLASKADHWLRVRPGTDAALALSISHVMIENGWYDEEFVRNWTNAALLVSGDRLVRDPGEASNFVAWDETANEAIAYDPSTGTFPVDASRLALRGTFVSGRPVFELLAEQCAQYPPAVAETITGVPADDIVATARMLWEARPVAFYAWSGLEQHSNTTQTIRAINVLYALTGCLDARGGNVLLPTVPANRIDGVHLLAPEQRAKTIGIERRPLGTARFEFVTGEDLYTAALDAQPYRARGLVGFGSNLVMAHGDSARGRVALQALDFYVHVDLFMSPTAELADIVLPTTSAFETEALRIGFEVSEAAQSLVQLRRPLVPARGEARGDLRIIFDLATRLGLDDAFFGGDIDVAWRHHLEPSGITLEQLRADPGGVRVPLTTHYRKFTEADADGNARGFRTPTRKIELFSETFAVQGYPSLPEFVEPAMSPVSRPDLAERFPLVLTCTKSLRFCETQHRNIAALRGPAPDPEVELHPDTAAARGISAGDWVELTTPTGAVRARAKFNTTIDPNVVCGQHGWWQACPELDLPGYPPYGPGSANLNLVLAQTPSDPVGGSSPLRASLCEISLASS